MKLTPHIVGKDRARVAFTTDPPMTAAIYSKAKPRFARMNFPPSVFLPDEGKVMFTKNSFVFEIPANMRDLQACMENAQAEAAKEQALKDRDDQAFLDRFKLAK